MRVVFTKDVPTVARRYDIKDVSDGYARNFLFPRKLAEPATPNTLKGLKDALEKHARKTLLSIDQARAIADRLAVIHPVFRTKADEAGKTFGSVSKAHIVRELAKHDIAVEKDDILLSEPIRSVGETTVQIALHPNLTVSVPIRVETESKQESRKTTPKR